MSDTDQTAPNAPSELDMLKQRAKLMGITFSNNISLETLRAKVAAKLEGTEEPAEPAEAPAPLVDPAEAALTPAAPAVDVRSPRQKAYEEATALIRCRIACLHPDKRDLHGEIFTVGNEVVGTIRKFIPYGEATENGYHIPKILYDQLKDRKFNNIQTSKKAGQITVKTGWVPEFAIEVLPPLTQDELNRLAAAQAAAGGLGD